MIWVAVKVLVEIVVTFNGVSVLVALMVPDGTVTVTLDRVLLYLPRSTPPRPVQDSGG